MLEDYCNSLSDEAQLKIALRLGKLALSVWEKFFAEKPDEIEKVNILIEASNRVQGGAKKIDVNFPARALEKIERSFINANKKDSLPIPRMKSDGTLSPLLATSMQPLTNPKWDETLPYPVRLVFTLVWNIVSWILYKRRTDANETHIYVAINQAADVLMSEKILNARQIEEILNEYQKETRKENEDAAWENSPGIQKYEALEPDEIYRKIIGEKIVKNSSGRELAKEIVRQMREEGKSFWDQWEEYYSGTCITYSYNKEKNSFWRSELDVIVASFFNEFPMTEQEMIDFISGVSLTDLRESGFEI
jgi:hypothetical protein